MSAPNGLSTVTDEAWQRALSCAHSVMESYHAKPHISTDEGRKRALDDAMQHAFGLLSLCVAQASLPPIVDRDELIALLQDLASVNLSREAVERQARRMADDLIARGLTFAAPQPASNAPPVFADCSTLGTLPQSVQGDKTWEPVDFWKFVSGLAGEFEAGQMRDMLAERGLQIVGISDPAYISRDAVIEECARAVDTMFDNGPNKVSRAVRALALPSTPRATPVMQAAENASKVVEGWSDAKREYADRVTGPQPCIFPKCTDGDLSHEAFKDCKLCSVTSTHRSGEA